MRSIILTIGFVMTSVVAMSQYVEVDRGEFPMQEWYQIPGEQFEGGQYMTSSDAWIKNYLKEMLAEDGQSIEKPDSVEYDNGVAVYMVWEYTTLSGDEVFVSYLNNGPISDIAFYYMD